MNSKINWNRVNRLPFFTYLFLGIQIFMYLLMELTGIKNGIWNGSENVSILFQFGAMTHSAINVNGEYWRLVTPIFIHIGFFHILINSLTLYFVGRLLEPIIGHTRFLVVYLLSGIMGNLLSFAFGSSQSISAGASTSLFGLFAAFIILGRIYPYQQRIQQISRNMLLLIVLNLFMNLFDSGVDMLGHMGGVVGGVLLMLVVGVPKTNYTFKKNISPTNRIISLIVLVLLAVFCFNFGMIVNN